MADPTYTDDFLREILTTARTIAVVGASREFKRPSHAITRFLISHGYTVIPVNPHLNRENLFGQPSYDSLAQVPGPIDIVDIFRRSEVVGPIVDEAISVKAKVVWMQLGIRDDAAAARAEAAGLKVVMNRCIRIEHRRLGI